MVKEFDNVGIVGAGISGLTAALALSRRGASVQIYERSPSLTEAGAGIWVPPNGMRVLALLGLAEKVKCAGIEITRAALHDYRAGLLQSIETKCIAGWPTVAIHRQTLQQILRDHVPAESVRLGHELTGLKQETDSVSLLFSNAATRRARIVLGADGIRSATRRALFPAAKLRYSGQTSWRAVVPLHTSWNDLHKSIEIWAPGGRFGYSAISTNQIYWYATADATSGQRESSEQSKERLLRLAGVFPAEIRDLVLATPPETLLRTDLWDLPGLTPWHRDRVLLLGDAAHAATPNLGQGGAQGMEDAWIVAETLATASDIPAAFLEFERKRKERIQSVARMAWMLGKAAHLNGPRRWLRNLAFRATPNAIARRQINALYKSLQIPSVK